MTRPRTTPVAARRPVAVDPVLPEHPADRAVRLRDRSAVEEKDRAAFDAVVAAFDRYEAGDDEAARRSLQEVGLGSPFLEWKLLLRGLVAYSAGDDARARENWERLDPQRLPYRAAAPLRAAIDPAFRQSLPDAVRRKLETATGDRVVEGLSQIRTLLGRGKSLAGAFRKLDSVLPLVRAQAPHLVPRLARCFYRAILANGEPTDLPRYLRAFGPPADDPRFDRLQALVNEDADNLEAATRHWLAYEGWLTGGAAGLPDDLARRARAIILNHLGNLATREADSPQRQLRELFDSLVSSPRLRARLPAPPDPRQYWQRAAALEPGWDAPVRSLFLRLVQADQPAEAEAVARAHLEHHPRSLEVLDGLAGLLAQGGRADESLALRLRILEIDPLDRMVRMMVAVATISVARRQLMDKAYRAAEETLAGGEKLCRESTLPGFLVIRSVAARGLKRAAEADALAVEALADPGNRAAAALLLSVDSALAKLKPADRKRADAELAAALAAPVPPRAATLLYAVWDQYAAEGISYRGQKGHEKKIREVILRAPEVDAPEPDFENLGRMCATRKDWKVVGKLADALRRKFALNPVFPLLLVESEVHQRNGRPWSSKNIRLLRDAYHLAERSPQPRHRDVLDRVRDLCDQIGVNLNGPAGFLPFDF